jgi:hypothetical protein
MSPWKHFASIGVAAGMLLMGTMAEAKTPGGWSQGSKPWGGSVGTFSSTTTSGGYVTPPGFGSGGKNGFSTGTTTDPRMPRGLSK